MIENRYLQYKEKFLNGDLKGCKSFFAKKGYILEYAYCKLLEDDLKGAKQLFAKMKDFDNRALWGYKLVTILQKKSVPDKIDYDDMPSFFQLRNFLELDLNLFMRYRKGDFVEILCSYSDIFATINAETYKFFTRVFYFDNYPQFANFFAERAKEYFYNDPELHYQIALMKYSDGDKLEARKYCLSCLHILKGYFPAEQMLNRLTFAN